MKSEYPGGSENFRHQPPWELAAPGQRMKLERGNVKYKSQTHPELSWREASNTDGENKSIRIPSREVHCLEWDST